MREFILFCSIFVGNWNWERATKIRLSTTEGRRHRWWTWKYFRSDGLGSCSWENGPDDLGSPQQAPCRIDEVIFAANFIEHLDWGRIEISCIFKPFLAIPCWTPRQNPNTFPSRVEYMGIEKGKNVNPTFETHGKMQSICQHWAAVLFWRMMCVDLKRRYQKWHLIAANRQTTTHLTILNACLVKWVLACFWFNLWQSVTQ